MGVRPCFLDRKLVDNQRLLVVPPEVHAEVAILGLDGPLADKPGQVFELVFTGSPLRLKGYFQLPVPGRQDAVIGGEQGQLRSNGLKPYQAFLNGGIQAKKAERLALYEDLSPLPVLKDVGVGFLDLRAAAKCFPG